MFIISIKLALVIIFIALIAEYFDSALGMGYGTSLTPILLILGFAPMQIVPAILLSEFITGILAGITHHILGNVDFSVKTKDPTKIAEDIKKHGFINTLKVGMSENLKMVAIIATCSILGAVFSVMVAVNLSKTYLTLYIGVLICAIGIYILITLNKVMEFSWKRLGIISVIASFNKGLSGGGYGPVVTGGQLLSGVDGKNAIAITSLAEGLTCIVGLIVYFVTGAKIDWVLAPYLIIGGVLSVPLAVLTIKKISTKRVRLYVGITTIILGMVTLYKLV